MDLANVPAFISQFNAADFLWMAGAVVLAIIAIKTVARILKVVFIAGAILMALAFIFFSGILPI